MKKLILALQMLRVCNQKLQNDVAVEFLAGCQLMPNRGICHNLDRILFAWESLPTQTEEQCIKEIVEKWPMFSGDGAYPVAHPTLSPEAAFNSADNKWVGTYGANRLSLLNHLISELSK